MNTKIVLSIIGAVLIVVLAVAYFTLPAATPQSTSSQTSVASSSPTTATASSTQSYTMAQVEQHNSASSCWTAINGNVYDVTSWISQHPGGPQHILPLCGTDGSAAFNAQHGGEAQPAQELATFYIGTLAQ